MAFCPKTQQNVKTLGFVLVREVYKREITHSIQPAIYKLEYLAREPLSGLVGELLNR